MVGIFLRSGWLVVVGGVVWSVGFDLSATMPNKASIMGTLGSWRSPLTSVYTEPVINGLSSALKATSWAAWNSFSRFPAYNPIKLEGFERNDGDERCGRTIDILAYIRGLRKKSSVVTVCMTSSVKLSLDSNSNTSYLLS
jgi:hypothetical protein